MSRKKYALMLSYIAYKYLKLSYKYPFVIMRIKENPAAAFFLDILSVKCNSIFNLIWRNGLVKIVQSKEPVDTGYVPGEKMGNRQ